MSAWAIAIEIAADPESEVEGRPWMGKPRWAWARFTDKHGLTPETSPAYRGQTTLFFVGGGAVVSGASTPGEFAGLGDIIGGNN